MTDPFIVYHFFDLLESQYKRLNLSVSPDQIFNLDETAFFLDPRGGKVVSEPGARVQRLVAGSGRSCFTSMACVSANGKGLPPLVIFEGKHLYSSWRGKKALLAPLMLFLVIKWNYRVISENHDI